MSEQKPIVYGGVEVPHSGQFYECHGALSIFEPAFNELMARIRMEDPQVHVRVAAADKEAASAPGAYALLPNGVAVIELVGAMTKYGSSLSRMEGGSTGKRRAVRQAAADDAVKAILLRIDSPGGSVAGTGDLAEAVWEANQKKPVTAFIEDLGASAAYYVASQAGRMVATKDSLVGSIGVYTVIQDWSGLAAREGVKVHVVKAGAYKGVGVQGTEVTADHLADLQRVINELNEPFAAAVARGRRMTREQVATINDGRIHGAAQALALGLIDAVGTLDAAISELAARIGRGGSVTRKETAMSTATEAPAAQATEKKAATTAELKAAFPKSTAEWRESCTEKGMSLAEAKDAWIVHQDAAMAKLEEEKKTAEAKAAAGGKAAGAPAVAAGTGAAADDGGDVFAEFEEAVLAAMKGGKPRAEAVKAVRKSNPQLCDRYEAAYNKKHP